MTIKQIFFMLTFMTISNSLADRSRAFKMCTNPDRFEQSLPTDSSRFGKTFVLGPSYRNFELMGKLEDVDSQDIKEVIERMGKALSGVDTSDWINPSMRMLEISFNPEIRDIAHKTLKLMQHPLTQELLMSQIHKESKIPCVFCPSFETYKDEDYDAIIFDTDDVNECEKLKELSKNLSEEQKEKILAQRIQK